MYIYVLKAFFIPCFPFFNDFDEFLHFKFTEDFMLDNMDQKQLLNKIG